MGHTKKIFKKMKLNNTCILPCIAEKTDNFQNEFFRHLRLPFTIDYVKVFFLFVILTRQILSI